MKLKNATLADALAALGENRNLTYGAVGNIIMLADANGIPEHRFARVYDVAGLVPSTRDIGRETRKRMRDQIRQINPATWTPDDRVEWKGQLELFGSALVVENDWPTQEAVADQLLKLRKSPSQTTKPSRAVERQ